MSGSRLFWTDRDLGEIRSISLNGENEQLITSSATLPELSQPIDIIALGNYLYIRTLSSDRLIRVLKNGGCPEAIGSPHPMFTSTGKLIIDEVLTPAAGTVTTTKSGMFRLVDLKAPRATDCKRQHSEHEMESCIRCGMKCIRALHCQGFKYNRHGQCLLQTECGNLAGIDYFRYR
ncbi:uncharacterized protein LOC117122926 [Anneissia japonica]|uniref:uncharacterized protein LOC117122926 n=1 Tax=Anneissia japonica TaxID=1529436 RepID=UPI0014257B3E|nr:uncharacterized protein LOC117122926 [Anneissia japonica]